MTFIQKWLSVFALTACTLVLLLWMYMTFDSERTPSPLPLDVLASASIRATEYAPAIAQATVHLKAMMAERQIPGLSIAVAVEGKTVWSEGFGFADLGNRKPATPQTQYRIASLSKLLTVASMARLYEEGKIDLDVPVQTYVPSFPKKAHDITVRQLASHTAGIRPYRDDQEAMNTTRYATVTASLEKFKDDTLHFAPGKGFVYSSYGYVLLSAAVEGASGKDFLSLVRSSVLTPLGMESTREIRVDSMGPREATCYDTETPYSPDGAMVPSPFMDFSSKWGSGGFLSTTEDLVRFGNAHLSRVHQGFLKEETLDMMFTPVTGLGGLIGYGLGWSSIYDLRLRRIHLHFGATSGGTSVLAIFPGSGVTITLLANLGHARFPSNRLMNIANPFLPDPSFPVKVLFGLILAGGWVLYFRKK
jgi:CubicO group peptidase (beta-lactamase class C family)